MLKTASYIGDMAEQLSQMAKDCGMHDLAFLLKLATQEARLNEARIQLSPAATLLRLPVGKPS